MADGTQGSTPVGIWKMVWSRRRLWTGRICTVTVHDRWLEVQRPRRPRGWTVTGSGTAIGLRTCLFLGTCRAGRPPGASLLRNLDVGDSLLLGRPAFAFGLGGR